MGTTSGISNVERLEKLWESLQAAERLQDDRLTFGLDHVSLYVEDVESDWLEIWGVDEDEDEINPMPVNLALRADQCDRPS